MNEKDAYMSYVGDCVGQAEESIASDWMDANTEMLKQVKEFLNDVDYKKVEAIVKKIGPY